MQGRPPVPRDVAAEPSLVWNSFHLGAFIALGASVGVAIGAGSHHVGKPLPSARQSARSWIDQR